MLKITFTFFSLLDTKDTNFRVFVFIATIWDIHNIYIVDWGGLKERELAIGED
jgi:hypothetical protein